MGGGCGSRVWGGGCDVMGVGLVRENYVNGGCGDIDEGVRRWVWVSGGVCRSGIVGVGRWVWEVLGGGVSVVRWMWVW